MIALRNVGKQTCLVACVLCASMLLVATVWGQDPPTPQREVKAEIKMVVRISKQLIDDVVTRQEIMAKIPLDHMIMKFRCQGIIDGNGKLTTEMTTDKGDGRFIINSRGSFEVCSRDVRGPIVAFTPACGPFTSRTLVHFDGRKFTPVDTSVCLKVHIDLDRIEGRRGTRVGRAFGRMARPVGELLLPRAEREAWPVGSYILKNFVDDLSEKVVSKLNRTTRVEASLNRLFPETTGWEFQLSTDPGFIQAAYGPQGSEPPIMPENPGRLENTRMEIWLRATTKGGEAIEKLSKQPLAKPLIQRYLEATLPELAAITEERTVTFVDPWVVICIGKPKASELDD